MQAFLKNNSIEQAKRLLGDHALRPAGACFHFGVMLSEGKQRADNLDEFRRKLEICQGLDVPILVVPTDFPERDVVGEDYDRAAAGLAEAAQIAEPYGVALAVEFIKGAKLVGTLRTAAHLVRATGKDNVGILLDTFHLCAGASKLADIDDLAARELFLVHINDMLPVQVEIAQDRDRTFPGEGVLPLQRLLAKIKKIGYDGYYSLELFNEQLWDAEVRVAATQAFQKTAAFMQKLANS